MENEIRVKYVQNLHPIFTKPKRIKIVVGGRGSTKSTGIADYIIGKMSEGDLWCCARERLNSIEESVHRTILEEIERLKFADFMDTKSGIVHDKSGGRCFYRGLSINISSLKSTLSGIDGLWIEEGEDISEASLKILTASVRLNAAETQELLNGKDIFTIDDLDELLRDSNIKMPEIIITMNRGSQAGAVAKKWLARAESELMRCGFYEDDVLMVVQMNYTDMPRSWFLASGLEQERLDDKENLSVAEYRHKWHGEYLDTVENAIIKQEWFEAAIDAHLDPKLKEAFAPLGAIKASYDPFDGGSDAGGFAVRHGSIITQVSSKHTGGVDEVTDWATDLARKASADWFIWDGDGMGTGLKRQVSDAFKGTHCQYHMFRGSLSGKAQDNANQIYMPADGEAAVKKAKTYADTFLNNRAQYYVLMATRFHNVYKCRIKGQYIDPAEMISLSSEGIEDMISLRSQICRIPRKPNSRGLEQIMSKEEMKKLKIPSPNDADAVMMTEFTPPIDEDFEEIDFKGW